MTDNQSLMCRPKCHVHEKPMELREKKSMTKEQEFCGAWYDCQYPGCHVSVLFPSKELRLQLGQE